MLKKQPFLQRLLFCLILPGMIVCQNASGQKHPFGFDDYIALRRAQARSVSPDGKSILYLVAFGAAKGPEKNEWWLTDFSGEHPQKLDLPEAFHPAGFTREGALYGGYDVGKLQQLAIIPIGQGKPTRIITLASGIKSIAISPDGARFALLADPRAKDPLGDVHTVVENEQTSLYVMNVNGGEGGWWCPSLTDVTEISWAPDASQLAVVMQPQKIGHHEVHTSIYSCNASGARKITEVPSATSGIAWDKGGRDLVFTSTNTLVLTPEHVWSVPVAGGQAVDRTPQLEGTATNVLSDPHGTVWVEVHRGVVTEIDKYHDGKLTSAYRWPGGILSSLPAFPAFSSSPDVQALSVLDPQHAENVAVPDDTNLKRITHEGDNVLANVALGEVRVVHWTSKEGIKLEGIATFPPNYAPDKKWPFLVLPHGGPEANDELTFSLFTRFIAGMGYVVLQPQYRGSTGYGSDFLAAIYQHFGDRAYRDVDSATDYAIEQGWADPKRLAMFGWSAGGFMTAWSVTQTNRYRAAIEGAGITDWLSFIPTSDIWQVDYDARLQEKDPAPMLQFSAAMFADRVTTPLLILHGEADLRVPMLQGRELFVLLAERGKTVRMVTYPGSPHFPTLFEQRRDLLKEIQDWLQKYNP